MKGANQTEETESFAKKWFESWWRTKAFSVRLNILRSTSVTTFFYLI